MVIKMNENKANINWYPGHMAKTKRLIKEKIDLIDVVYELVDSRIPYSSKIVDIDDLISNKKRILIMTKYDLCDKEETQKWIEYYENLGYKVLTANLKSSEFVDKLIKLTHELMEDIQKERINKGLKEKDIKVLVIGIPNVGKSTLINKLAKRNATITGNTPGVTKTLSFIKTNSNIILLDSPGMLWPKLDNQEVSLNLASMSAIKSEILPVDEVAVFILKKLNSYYPQLLKERYNIEELTDDFAFIYDKIGKKIGALIKGGEVDYDKVSLTILNDMKNEYIKGITFDRR